MTFLGRYLLRDTNFLTAISKILFYCCEKIFTPMNICMISKGSEKHD